MSRSEHQPHKSKEARELRSLLEANVKDYRKTALQYIHIEMPKWVRRFEEILESTPYLAPDYCEKMEEKFREEIQSLEPPNELQRLNRISMGLPPEEKEKDAMPTDKEPDEEGVAKDSEGMEDDAQVPPRKRAPKSLPSTGASAESCCSCKCHCGCSCSCCEKPSKGLEKDSNPGDRDPRMPVIMKGRYEFRELEKLFKPLVKDISNKLDIIKLFIQCNVPGAEDGNNFGVDIQEEVIGEVSRVSDTLLMIIDNFFSYYSNRASIVHRARKSPLSHIFELIIQYDAKELFSLRLWCIDARNNLMILYDLILKNIKYIEKPKGSDTLMSMV